MELRQFLDNRFRRPKIKLVTDGDADITIIRRDDELFYVTVDNKEDGKSIFPLDQPPVISTARTQHPFKESYIGGAEDVENAFKIFLNDRGISLLLATRDYSISLSHTKTAMAYSCAIGYGCNASVSWK
ncbi:MAG: hypothetical protein HYT98_02290 [Candidatus Sungbacteria bacterium]|nr:hypothetical protein [Candidatus Sungbacteria bacterium]